MQRETGECFQTIESKTKEKTVKKQFWKKWALRMMLPLINIISVKICNETVN